ncbi:MAG: WbqC family protein [Bacteroidota bacterium]|nr:WbqC family protein [Bacteroidota bacterium]
MIMQPYYLFLRKHFHQVQLADLYIFMDDVQFVKNSHHNRNRIKGAEGLIWLTVPVFHKGKSGQQLKEVRIDNNKNWRKKHWLSMVNNYSKAPYFKMYSGFFEDVYKRDWEKLIELNIYMIKNISDFLGINNTEFICLSELNIFKDNPTQRLIEVCENVKATEYIIGTRAKDYMEEDRWKETDVKLNYFEPRYPTYPQLYGSFADNCSIIDLLFNCGKDSGDYIWNGDKGR